MRMEMVSIKDLQGSSVRWNLCEDLDQLVQNILQNGLESPILIKDGLIKDGFRRVEAFKFLNWKKIPAYIVE